MSRVHYEYMPTEEDCGYCSHCRLNDSKGIKCYCTEHRSYYQINDRCRKQEYVNRDERDIEKFLRWWVSSMIGVLLNKDIKEKPFSNIGILKEYVEGNPELNNYAKLYDIYGPWISECLRYDLDKEFIASLIPVLNKISDFVDKGMMQEAFKGYYNLVSMLYKRYIYTFYHTSKDFRLVKER